MWPIVQACYFLKWPHDTRKNFLVINKSPPMKHFIPKENPYIESKGHKRNHSVCSFITMDSCMSATFIHAITRHKLLSLCPDTKYANRKKPSPFNHTTRDILTSFPWSTENYYESCRSIFFPPPPSKNTTKHPDVIEYLDPSRGAKSPCLSTHEKLEKW